FKKLKRSNRTSPPCGTGGSTLKRGAAPTARTGMRKKEGRLLFGRSALALRLAVGYGLNEDASPLAAG
ncbi:MAG: hypothetical protein ACKO0N_01945, partial [Planctomycetota bacterium]